MARSVKVGAFQAMQRQQATEHLVEADPFAIDPAAEDAAATAQLKEIGCGPIAPTPELTIEVAADPLADLLHAEDETGYPVASDLPCDECGGEVMLRSAEEDRLLASRVAEGVEIEVLCDACAAAEDPGESGPGSAMFAEQTADEESGYDGPSFEPKAEDRIDRQLDSVARSMANAVVNGRVAQISVTPSDGINADDEPAIADELQSLDVGARCTAEMSLHMITERVRVATEGLPNAHEITESDVVLEAERIWVSLDRKRSHTYSVEQDGSVRDWRRPDTTPDRGDVTAVHTITDETEEPRFSGSGSDDGQQASMFLVPSDSDFRGKLYRDAPELANIAERLIESKDYLEHLTHCEIRYAWRRKSSSSKRRRQTGGLKRGSDWFGQLLGADFGIWLASDTARERHWSPRHVERYLLHEMLRIGQDDHGNFVEQASTLQVFAPEITEYADVADADDKIGRSAFQAAEQMGLFSDEDDDEEGAEITVTSGDLDDLARDGAGVLIHADGTPLTDDEIEAMERHELNDDPAEDIDDDAAYGERLKSAFGLADVPADPDGPAPDELEDDL